MAEHFFRTVGSIVGIGVGTLTVDLLRTGFVAGETVQGRVVLALKAEVEAKRLVAVLEATRKRTAWVDDGRGGRTQRTESTTVHRFEQQLAGAGTYLDGGYPLALPLPADATAHLPAGTLGDVARVVSAVGQALNGPLSWRVHAFLDIPWKANVKGQVDIAVR